MKSVKVTYKEKFSCAFSCDVKLTFYFLQNPNKLRIFFDAKIGLKLRVWFQSHALSLFTWFLKKNQVQRTGFLTCKNQFWNWPFEGYTGSKNPVRNRLKIQFVELDFSKIKYRWIGHMLYTGFLNWYFSWEPIYIMQLKWQCPFFEGSVSFFKNLHLADALGLCL